MCVPRSVWVSRAVPDSARIELEVSLQHFRHARNTFASAGTFQIADTQLKAAGCQNGVVVKPGVIPAGQVSASFNAVTFNHCELP